MASSWVSTCCKRQARRCPESPSSGGPPMRTVGPDPAAQHAAERQAQAGQDHHAPDEAPSIPEQGATCGWCERIAEAVDGRTSHDLGST
jgi:hypothetical protein